MGISPRLHNTYSYLSATAVFWLVAIVTSRRAADGAVPLGFHVAAVVWTAHFVRRSIESAFVHRYSSRSIGWVDALCEYAYYWGFGSWAAAVTTDPGYLLPAAGRVAAGLTLFCIGEFGNAISHQLLRRLRPQHADNAPHIIPHGPLFELVSCPHYTFELLSWLGAAIALGAWAFWAFFFVGLCILTVYAHSRHEAYLKEFNGCNGQPKYPPSRKRIIPLVL